MTVLAYAAGRPDVAAPVGELGVAGFEVSYVRDVVMWLDGDPDVAAVASQPHWAEPSWPWRRPEAVTADEKIYAGQFLQPLLCQ